MVLDNYENLVKEQKLIASHYKPTHACPIQPLANISKSYTLFYRDILKLYACDHKVLLREVTNTAVVEYILVINPYEYLSSPHSFQKCKETGEAFTAVLSKNIKVIKRVVTKKSHEDLEVSETTLFDNNVKDIIPIYVDIYGRSADGHHTTKDDVKELGTLFLNANHVGRNLNIILDFSTSPQVRLSKPDKNKNPASVSSEPLRSVREEVYNSPQYLKMEFMAGELYVSSNFKRNPLKSCSMIHLIVCLTNLSFDNLQTYLISCFPTTKKTLNDKNYNLEIHKVIEGYISAAKLRIEEAKLPGETSKACLERVMQMILNSLRSDHSTLQYSSLLPMVNSVIVLMNRTPSLRGYSKFELRMKGFTLVNYLVQYLCAVYQAPVYLPNNHIIQGSTLFPGSLLEKTITADLTRTILKYTNAVEQMLRTPDSKSLKIEKVLKNTISLSPAKNTLLSVAIKLTSTLYSDISKMNQANTRTKSTAAFSTKTKKKDVDVSKSFHVGAATTPDNSNANQQFVLNTGVISGNKSLEKHWDCAQKIITCLYESPLFIPSTDQPNPTDLTISLVDTADAVIGFVSQDNCKALMSHLRKQKRQGFLGSPYISIWLVPTYSGEQDRGILLPHGTFSNLRISLGHFDLFRPAIIVEKGIPSIFKLQPNDPIFELSHEEMIDQNPNIIEYLGCGELTFEEHTMTLKSFLEKDLKTRKRIKFILLGDILNKAINEAMTIETEKEPGARGCFGTHQRKSEVGHCATYPNSNEATKTTLLNKQVSFLTNPLLEALQVHSRSTSHMITVAWTSDSTAEDSCLFSESTQRTLFITDKKKCWKTTESFSSTSQQNIPNPNYDAAGKILEGAAILPGEAFNQDVCRYVQHGVMYRNDKSCIYDARQPGYVVKVIPTEEGWKYVITSRQEVTTGDKMADPCAQKSTIQEVRPDALMPYDINGNRVSVVQNPFSIFSRRTYNVLAVLLLFFIAKLNQLRNSSHVTNINISVYAQMSIAELQTILILLLKTQYDFTDEEISHIVNCKMNYYDPVTGKRLIQAWTVGTYPFSRMTQTAQDSSTIKPAFQFNINNEVVGTRHNEMDNTAQAETGARFAHAELQAENIMIRRSVMLCSNCGQPTTEIKRAGMAFWSCQNCMAANLPTKIIKRVVSTPAREIIQMIPSLNIALVHEEVKTPFATCYPKLE